MPHSLPSHLPIKVENPKRFVRLFRPQFKDLILSGVKYQTFRPHPKRMPRPGDILDARQWSGQPYASPQEKLALFQINSVHLCTLWPDRVAFIGWQIKQPGALDGFAQNDGFQTWPHFLEFMTRQYKTFPANPIEGILITWRFPAVRAYQAAS